MSQCLEGLFYEYLEKRYTEKDKQYQIMRVKNILDFYHVLEHNFENTCKYKLTHKSNILIVDHIHKQSKTITLTKEDFQKIQTLKEDWDSISKFIRNTYLSTLTES
jgi:3-dehydroquinate synthetase